jgi:hypothetical protein
VSAIGPWREITPAVIDGIDWLRPDHVDESLMIGTHLPGKTAYRVHPHGETWRLT